MELSKQARHFLKQLRARIGAAETLRCSNGPVLNEVLAFSEAHEIELGKTINSQTFAINRKALTAIKKICDYTQDLSALDRTQAPEFTDNEKQAGIHPTHYRVLAAITNQQFNQSYTVPQLNVELDIRALTLTDFSHFVVIENRDSFNAWHRFQLTKMLENPLVLYRGDGEEGKWLTLLAEQWREQREGKPTVFFGDFDLPGMRMALAYDNWLLPDINWLANNLIPQHYEAGHQSYSSNLEIDCPESWRPLLNLILNSQKALRQQWMEGVPLEIYQR